MFGHIAPSYDLLNHLLSLNVDRYWRWRTTRLVPPRGDAPILDVCTGTGDLALAYAHAAPDVPIVGTDFCHEMLVPATHKARRAAPGRIQFLEADTQRLPFVGQFLSRSKDNAYRYLPASVREFPDGEALAQRLRRHGLMDVHFHTLTFGIATLYVGTKPK